MLKHRKVFFKISRRVVFDYWLQGRRSFRVSDDSINEEPNAEEFVDELRTRHSINQVVDSPLFKSPSKQVGGDPDITSSNFLLSLKLAAENVIFLFSPITKGCGFQSINNFSVTKIFTRIVYLHDL